MFQVFIKAPEVMFPLELELHDLLKGYRQERESHLFEITSEQFVADRSAETRGTANPSVMNKAFWKSQVGPDRMRAWTARGWFGNEEDPFAASKDPVWCFIRFGATGTKLPDGRLVCIGGEHEDGYDPDFCIYNGKSFPYVMEVQKIECGFYIHSLSAAVVSTNGSIHWLIGAGRCGSL